MSVRIAEIRFIRFIIPITEDGKKKNLKFFHIQVRKNVLNDFIPYFKWKYIYDERKEFKNIPKVVSSKKEGIKFMKSMIQKQHNLVFVSDPLLLVHPTLNKI